VLFKTRVPKARVAHPTQLVPTGTAINAIGVKFLLASRLHNGLHIDHVTSSEGGTMPSLTQRLPLGALLCSAAILAACGGSDGGGDTGAASAPVTINAANAPTVAGTAYAAGSSLEGAGVIGDGGLVTGVVTETAATGVDMIDVIVDQLAAGRAWYADNGAAFVTGVTATENCTDGGDLTFTVDDADGNPSSGDSLSASYNNCVEGDTVLNGSISIVINSYDGDPQGVGAFSLQLSIQANNFTATQNGETTSLNGAMTLSQSTNDGVAFTNSISGTSIVVNGSGVSAALSAFQLTSTENNGDYTLVINATVSSSQIGGAVTIVTTTPFRSIAPGHPYEGQAIITGANGTSVTLIAISDAQSVRLLVDETGNGTPDRVIDTTWDAL
jgi:hypothetical protein